MAVDEHVDAGDVLQQVDGAVAGGLCVNAQVAQADDVVTASGGELVHLLLGAGEEFLLSQEGDALQLSGVGLGGSFRGGQTKDAHGHVAQLEGEVVAIHGQVTFGGEGIGSQDGDCLLYTSSPPSGPSTARPPGPCPWAARAPIGSLTSPWCSR